MNRFENVDVLAALEQLMRQNTAFYRNDFEIDKEIIGRDIHKSVLSSALSLAAAHPMISLSISKSLR